MEDIGKRYHSLKHNKNFEKLTVEYLILTLAKNIDYLFLILATLALLNIINFNITTSHFPYLSLSSEWTKIRALDYNPVLIYGHYLWTFILITKGFATGFIDTLKNNLEPALLASILIVNTWLAYTHMKYGYDQRSSDRHNAFFALVKNYLFSSSMLERSLATMFFIDLMIILTTPLKPEIMFLLAVYLLVLSVKFVPWLTRIIIFFSEKVDETAVYNEWVLRGIGLLNAILIYYDSQSLFTLFVMILIYNAIAGAVLHLSKNFKNVRKAAVYAFSFGIILFFMSIAAIYWIALAAIMIVQLPLIAYYYWKHKRFLPSWMIEAVNLVMLVILMMRVF